MAALCGGALPEPQAEPLSEARKLQQKGDLKGAAGVLDPAIQRARAGGQGAGVCELLNELAAVQLDLGDYSAAWKNGDEATALCLKISNSALAAQSTNTSGQAYLYHGSYTEALMRFQQSLGLCRQVGDHRREIYRVNNIGNTHYFQGQYLEALRYYQQAQEELKNWSAAPWWAAMHQLTTGNLAVLFQRLGMEGRTLELYKEIQALPIALSPNEEARLITNEGTLYRRLGDPAMALERYRKALVLFGKQSHLDGEIGTLKNIAIVEALDFKDFAAAERSFLQVLRRAESSSSLREVVQARLYLGEIKFRTGWNADARSHWQAALDLSRQLGTSEEEWKAQFGLGRLWALEGQREKAMEAYSRALAIIESVRSRIHVSSLRVEFLADKRDVYDALIQMHLNEPSSGRRQLEEVVSLLMRINARALNEDLRDSRWRQSAEGAVGAGALLALREEIVKAQAARQKAKNQSAAVLDAQIASLESRYLQLESNLPEEMAALLPAAAARVDLKTLESRLPDDTVLLMYWVGRDRIAAIWVSHGGSGLATAPLDADEARSWERWAGSLADPSSRNWAGATGAISAKLLGGVPPLASGGFRKLFIVPDGVVSAIPFELLPAPPASGAQRLVVERYAVAYLPSALLLPDVNRAASPRRLPWRRQVMAFGDPGRALAPGELAPQVLPGDEKWTRLPRSSEEVAVLAKIMPGAAELHVGPDAQKKYLLAGRVGMPDVIHISAHAVASIQDPRRSRILFSGSVPRQFEYLFMSEIRLLNLHGVDMVTLAACETERGRTIRGEGLQSMGRAFLSAGARSTVTTLWRVEDSFTSEFMKQFYYQLGKGASKAEALREAKLQFLRAGGGYSHPARWAGFVLSGEGFTPLPPVISWPVVISLAAGLPLVGALAVVVVRERRLRRPRDEPA